MGGEEVGYSKAAQVTSAHMGASQFAPQSVQAPQFHMLTETFAGISLSLSLSLSLSVFVCVCVYVGVAACATFAAASVPYAPRDLCLYV